MTELGVKTFTLKKSQIDMGKDQNNVEKITLSFVNDLYTMTIMVQYFIFLFIKYITVVKVGS